MVNFWATNMNFTKIIENTQNTRKVKLSSIQNTRKLRTSLRNLQDTSVQKYKGTHGYKNSNVQEQSGNWRSVEPMMMRHSVTHT